MSGNHDNGRSAKPSIVYLAGPEVFFPDALQLGLRKKAICREHGFDALFPLDVLPESTSTVPQDLGLAIFAICIEMMDRCDLAIANMTPFRGISMDVGTAVEVGYMFARGKPVFGYTNHVDDYERRVTSEVLSHADELVEGFGLFDNLMCEGPVR